MSTIVDAKANYQTPAITKVFSVPRPKTSNGDYCPNGWVSYITIVASGVVTLTPPSDWSLITYIPKDNNQTEIWLYKHYWTTGETQAQFNSSGSRGFTLSAKAFLDVADYYDTDISYNTNSGYGDISLPVTNTPGPNSYVMVILGGQLGWTFSLDSNSSWTLEDSIAANSPAPPMIVVSKTFPTAGTLIDQPNISFTGPKAGLVALVVAFTPKTNYPPHVVLDKPVSILESGETVDITANITTVSGDVASITWTSVSIVPVGAISNQDKAKVTYISPTTRGREETLQIIVTDVNGISSSPVFACIVTKPPKVSPAVYRMSENRTLIPVSASHI